MILTDCRCDYQLFCYSEFDLFCDADLAYNLSVLKHWIKKEDQCRVALYFSPAKIASHILQKPIDIR